MNSDGRTPQADSEKRHPLGERRSQGEDNDREFLYIRESFIFYLPNFTKRRTSKTMLQGDPLPHIRNMRGIAEELPVVRLKYLPADNDAAQKASTGNARIVQSLEENGARQKAGPIRINYTSYSGKASFGTDQMISYASVIHELAYGRISAGARQSASGEIDYPVPKESMRHSLDIFV